jgi:hypothetical protein
MARLRREHHRFLGKGHCTRPAELDCAYEESLAGVEHLQPEDATVVVDVEIDHPRVFAAVDWHGPGHVTSADLFHDEYDAARACRLRYVMSRRTATRVPNAAKASAQASSTSPPAACPSIASSTEVVSRPSALPA